MLDPDTRQNTPALGVSPRPLRRRTFASETRRALWYILVAWLFGASFAALTSGAPVTSFLTKYLQTDDMTYGLIMAAGPAAVLFQFLGSYVVERTGRVKRTFLLFVTAHRLVWLLVAAIPLALPHGPKVAQVGVVGLAIFTSSALANYGGAGWSAWMSAIVPKALAGKFFGVRASTGMFAMIVVSTVVTYLLDRFNTLGWMYALVFGVAAIMGAADIMLFIPVREAPRRVEATLPSFWELLTTPWRMALFRGYALYSTVTWMAYMMMSAFVWRLCFEPVTRQGLGMGVLQAHILLFVLSVLPMAVMAPFWGQAIDRLGPKPVLAVSSLAAIVLPIAWVFMRPELTWIIPVIAILGGLTWPGIEQVMIYMQIKGFPDERRTAYNATFLAIFGLASMIGTSLGGAIAAFWREHLTLLPMLPDWMTQYHMVFITSVVMRLAAFVFILPRLAMPGTAAHGAVARSIATHVAASLPRAVTTRRRR